MTLREGFQTVGKIVISSLVSAGILLLIYSFTKRDSAEIRLKEDVSKKAYKTYVDDQDRLLKSELEGDLNTYKVQHQTQHNATQVLLKSMDSKIDILLTEK